MSREQYGEYKHWSLGVRIIICPGKNIIVLGKTFLYWDWYYFTGLIILVYAAKEPKKISLVLSIYHKTVGNKLLTRDFVPSAAGGVSSSYLTRDYNFLCLLILSVPAHLWVRKVLFTCVVRFKCFCAGEIIFVMKLTDFWAEIATFWSDYVFCIA